MCVKGEFVLTHNDEDEDEGKYVIFNKSNRHRVTYNTSKIN